MTVAFLEVVKNSKVAQTSSVCKCKAFCSGRRMSEDINLENGISTHRQATSLATRVINNNNSSVYQNSFNGGQEDGDFYI